MTTRQCNFFSQRDKEIPTFGSYQIGHQKSGRCRLVKKWSFCKEGFEYDIGMLNWC